MIWHLLLKPLLRLVGNIVGYRPDLDTDYNPDGADIKIGIFLLCLSLPVSLVVIWLAVNR